MSLMLFYKCENFRNNSIIIFLILKVSNNVYLIIAAFLYKTSQKLIILKQNYKISLKNYICNVE